MMINLGTIFVEIKKNQLGLFLKQSINAKFDICRCGIFILIVIYLKLEALL